MCSIPLGHPIAWDLCHQQTKQILFIIILVRRASFPLVEVNGFIMTATRSVSMTSLGILGSARLARFPNRDVVPVDMADGWVEEVFVGDEDVGHWGVGKPWKLLMMGTKLSLPSEWDGPHGLAWLTSSLLTLTAWCREWGWHLGLPCWGGQGSNSPGGGCRYIPLHLLLPASHYWIVRLSSVPGTWYRSSAGCWQQRFCHQTLRQSLQAAPQWWGVGRWGSLQASLDVCLSRTVTWHGLWDWGWTWLALRMPCLRMSRGNWAPCSRKTWHHDWCHPMHLVWLV